MDPQQKAKVKRKASVSCVLERRRACSEEQAARDRATRPTEHAPIRGARLEGPAGEAAAEECLVVPARDVGRVIGARGETVAKHREATGASITLAMAGDLPEAPRRLAITGELVCVASARGNRCLSRRLPLV